MTLPETLRATLLEGLGQTTLDMFTVSGGSINQAVGLRIPGRTLFLKWNPNPPPKLFTYEAQGLALMRDTKTLRIPEVLAQGTTEDGIAWLLLEYMAGPTQVTDRDGFGRRLGQALAKMHRTLPPDGRYGLDHHNFMGSLPQTNTKHEDWPSFFKVCRLQPQIQLASKKIKNKQTIQQLNKLADALSRWLPTSPPASLLHGDLWSGNYMIDAQQNPVLIDPAAYYGHREVDLAMTRMFGGFPASFYQSYEETWPLEEDHKVRASIYQLYPLLIHVNLFGGGYTKQLSKAVQHLADTIL